MLSQKDEMQKRLRKYMMAEWRLKKQLKRQDIVMHE